MAVLRAGEVGLAPLTVGRPEPLEMLAAAEAGGFGRIGMTLWPPDGDLAAICTDRRLLGTTVTVLSRAGLRVVDVGVVVLRSGLDLRRVRRVVEAGAELGAACVIVINRHPYAARAAGCLASVAEIAGEVGLVAGLEFMPYSATPSLTDAVALVRAADSPRVGIVLDMLHLLRSGGASTDLSRTSGVPLVLVQLCDAVGAAPPRSRLRAESLTDRRYPGQGELPVRSVLAAVPSGVPVTLEAPVAEDAALPPAERARRAAGALRAFLAPSGSGGGADDAR